MGKTHYEFLQACCPSVSPSPSNSVLEQSRIQKTHISSNLTQLRVVLEVGRGGGCGELYGNNAWNILPKSHDSTLAS